MTGKVGGGHCSGIWVNHRRENVERHLVSAKAKKLLPCVCACGWIAESKRNQPWAVSGNARSAGRSVGRKFATHRSRKELNNSDVIIIGPCLPKCLRNVAFLDVRFHSLPVHRPSHSGTSAVLGRCYAEQTAVRCDLALFFYRHNWPNRKIVFDVDHLPPLGVNSFDCKFIHLKWKLW